MIKLPDFISNFPFDVPKSRFGQPWLWVKEINSIIEAQIRELGEGYSVQNGIAIHQSAVIEQNLTFKPPLIIGPNCHIGANAYFREGVFLDHDVKIGPSCEIKSSIICSHSAVAHLSYVGNSLIGSRVNFEGGSVAANHYNEREDKQISIIHDGVIWQTGLTKFGALVGDDVKIGANAVLSPGTILSKGSIVRRLELVEQLPKSR